MPAWGVRGLSEAVPRLWSVPIRITATAVLSYAMAHARIPLVTQVSVDSPSGPPGDATLELTVRDAAGPLTRPWSRLLPIGQGTVDISDVDLRLDPAAMLSRTDQAPGSIEAVLRDGDGAAVAEGRVDVTVLGAYQWCAVPTGLGLELLAAHVMPNAPEIAALVADAARLLRARTGDPSIQGYQAGPERVDAIAEAVFAALQARQPRYSEPPPSWGIIGQRVRTPAEVLAPDGVGTCLDLTLVYAAALEHAGIRPLVWVMDGHAFAGWWRDEASLPVIVSCEPHDLINLLGLGSIAVVETTTVTANPPVTWREAVQIPGRTQLLRADADHLGILDVWQARRHGILPLPAIVRDGHGALSVVEYRPADSQAPAARQEESRRPVGRQESVPGRFAVWQNALLDLSLRNRLINLTASTGVRVALPGGRLADVETELGRHRGLLLEPFDTGDRVAVARAGAPTGVDEISEDVRLHRLDARSLVVDLSGDRYRPAMQALAYKARTVQEETGANSLYLTLGELVWSLDGRELRSPLLLMPVRLTSIGGGGAYRLALDESEPTSLNHCLFEKLRHEFGLVIDQSRLAGEHGVDVAGVFDAVTLASLGLAESGHHFLIDRAASRLAVLQFTTYRLWKDIDTSWQRMREVPLIAHLVDTPGRDFVDPVPQPPVRSLDDLASLSPLSADASQLAAIDDAVAGRTFVLEGPPGTGKSQTITNLIAAAIAARRRVLFVAEKRAALDVVRARLRDIGLDELCLDLHDRSAKPSEVRAQLLRALDRLPVGADPLQRPRLTELSLRRSLERYVGAVHDRNGAGYSLYRATQESPDPDIAPLHVPEDVVARAGAEQAVSDAVSAFVDLAPAARIGFGTVHPWGWAPMADGVDVGAAWSQARELDSALAVVATTGWGPALDEARTPSDVRVLAWLASCQEPIPDVLSLGASDGWQQRLAKAVRDVDAARAELAALVPWVGVGFLGLDLDSLAADAHAAVGSSWWGRRGRCRNVQSRLDGVTVTRFHPREIADVADALVLVRDRGAALAADLTSRLPGIRLPAGWHPLLQRAGTALTTAADAVRGAALLVAGGRPALAECANAALARGYDARSDQAIARVSSALTSLASSLRADDRTCAEWTAERAFVPLWRDTAAARGLADPRASSLLAWCSAVAALGPVWRAGMHAAYQTLLTGGIDPVEAEIALTDGVVAASVAERRERGFPTGFSQPAQQGQVERYVQVSADLRRLVRDRLADDVLAHRGFAADSTIGTVGELRRALGRRRGGMSVRRLMETFGTLIGEVMPCALVSPDSVARFYPVTPGLFDLVVFDEASQIRVAEAIGPIARGRAVVVVGDSKQLPPTSFAEVTQTGDEVAEVSDIQDEESILSECVQAGLPRHWLSWHYRSQDEALIAFSNGLYYDGRLSSFPAPLPQRADPGPDGHGISLVRVPGTFLRSAPGARRRTNPEQADAIVAEIRARFASAPPGYVPSIGVVTFNIQQRAWIESLLRDSGDEAIVAALDAPRDGLFVKNLENVQGDERDVIMFSTAFSVNARGELPLNFGPLNLVGGERRLNVAVTRARRQVLVFTSFEPGQLRADQTSSLGVKHLRAYMDLAARATADPAAFGSTRTRVRDAHRDALADRLREAGLVVDADVGLSDFRIDLRLASPSAPDRPLVAVLLDGELWAGRHSIRDRFELPATVLTDLLRWPAVEQVWLPELLDDPQSVVDRLVDATRRAEAAAQVAPARWTLLEPSSPQTPGDESDDEPDGLVVSDVVGGTRVSELVAGVPGAERLLAGQGERGTGGWASGPGTSAAVGDATGEVGEGGRPAEGPTGHEHAADPGLTPDVPGAVPSWGAPLGRPSWRQRDTPWSPAVPGHAWALDGRDPASRAEVRDAVLACIEAEGPISPSRLAKAVARHFGLQRVTAQRQRQVLGVLPPAQWYWPAGVDPGSWLGWRHADDLPRPLTDIPDVEIRNAMMEIVYVTRGVTRPELIRETVRVLGRSKVTAAVETRLESVIYRALTDGWLVADGSRLMTKAAPPQP